MVSNEVGGGAEGVMGGDDSTGKAGSRSSSSYSSSLIASFNIYRK